MAKVAISLDKKKIELFCKKYHITSLALFGSVLTPHFTYNSDVDFLVRFDKKHIPTFFDLADMQSELSTIVGRDVDLKTPNGLSRYFRDEVVSKAKIIYGK